MLEDAKDRGIAQIPSTMAAFAVGSDVYFSSGLIGASFLINPGQVENFVQEGVAEEVALAIIRCQQTYSGDHHYNMRCAEPLAIQQYLVNNQGTSIIGKGKISTYGVLNVDNKSLVGILDPCNVSETRQVPRMLRLLTQSIQRGLGNWGCEVFLNKLQIPKVGNNKDQPGPSSVHTTQPPLKHCFWTE